MFEDEEPPPTLSMVKTQDCPPVSPFASRDETAVMIADAPPVLLQEWLAGACPDVPAPTVPFVPVRFPFEVMLEAVGSGSNQVPVATRLSIAAFMEGLLANAPRGVR